MKVLHITNWYPSKNNPERVKFIKEHFEALNLYNENHLIHIDIIKSSFFFNIKSEKLSSTEHSYEINCCSNSWFLKEIIITLFLIYILNKEGANRKYDVINFHVAYPLLTYYDLIKKFVKIPLVITEHWTAYQLNFNLPRNTHKLERIKKIFKKKIPLVAVSNALVKDIECFSGVKQNFKVVPNAVNTKIFSYKNFFQPANPVFFALNNWRKIKDPLTLLSAFRKLTDIYSKATLVIGGYGEMWEDMLQYVLTHNLKENVRFIGKLSPEQIASEMRGKTAFIHSSKVETFSVVVAEALCCGTPVIVTKLPCIQEYLNSKSGILVDHNYEHEWVKAFVHVIENQEDYRREEISKFYQKKFSRQEVGRQYSEYLQRI